MTGRDRLAVLLAPEALDALESFISETVDERLRVLSASRMAAKGQSPFMTVPEAAEYLRAKPQRVYDLLSARKLNRYPDGGRVLVKRAELEAYLTGNGARMTG